jgi:hypothetical protein
MKSRSVIRQPGPPAASPLPAAARAEAPPASGLQWFYRGWDRFWFSPADAYSLGLLRVIGGLLLLYTHISYGFDLLSYVSPELGWLDGQATQFFRKEVPVQAFPTNWADQPVEVGKGAFYWSIYYHVQDPRWIYTIHYGFFAILVLFTIGLWTRVTTVLAWIISLCYIQRITNMLFGMDAMLAIFLFYMMIAPCGDYFSVDRLLERWRARRQHGPDYPVPEPPPSVSANVALRGMQVHFCFIYMASGMSKLLGSTWWNGTALWACYANWSFAPLKVSIYYHTLVFLCQYRWLWEIVMGSFVLFTLFMELSFSFLVWLPRFRWLMVGGAVLLHTGIGLFMGLVTFSMFMICLAASFIPPQAVRHLMGEMRDYLQSFANKGSSAEPAKPAKLALTR